MKKKKSSSTGQFLNYYFNTENNVINEDFISHMKHTALIQNFIIVFYILDCCML